MFKKGDSPWNKGFKRIKSKHRNANQGNCFAKGNKHVTKAQASSGSSDSIQQDFYRGGVSEFSLIAKSSGDGQSIVTPDCEGISGSTCLLRPQSSSLQGKETVQNNKSENIIVNEEKIMEMFASTFRIHRKCMNTVGSKRQTRLARITGKASWTRQFRQHVTMHITKSDFNM